jgi:hypothetical protein
MTSKEKKREYNKNYQSKKKEREQQEVKEVEPIIAPHQGDQGEPKEDPNQGDQAEPIEEFEEETVVLDKASYEFLIEQAKKNTSTIESAAPKPAPEVKKESVDPPVASDNGFFFLVQQQCKIALAVAVPTLLLKGAMIGGQYWMNYKKNTISTDTSNRPNVTPNSFGNGFSGRMSEWG